MSSRARARLARGLGESANPTKPYMPVWGQVISAHQVSDLVAYIRAGLPSVARGDAAAGYHRPRPCGRGALLYQRFGCVNCHGPNGLGGVPNPQSPDKVEVYVPEGWFVIEQATEASSPRARSAPVQPAASASSAPR